LGSTDRSIMSLKLHRETLSQKLNFKFFEWFWQSMSHMYQSIFFNRTDWWLIWLFCFCFGPESHNLAQAHLKLTMQPKLQTQDSPPSQVLGLWMCTTPHLNFCIL
jgi:hypothetical protein